MAIITDSDDLTLGAGTNISNAVFSSPSSNSIATAMKITGSDPAAGASEAIRIFGNSTAALCENVR